MYWMRRGWGDCSWPWQILVNNIFPSLMELIALSWFRVWRDAVGNEGGVDLGRGGGGDKMNEPMLDEERMGQIVLGRGEFRKIICLQIDCPLLIPLMEGCGRK
mmetsp:Transcript_24298/g.39852  ORF Transcript_24298/g.39852 Transcript_24298/m.39852 type:complete len:103 (-) Transcript_24298:177-485(-)